LIARPVTKRAAARNFQNRSDPQRTRVDKKGPTTATRSAKGMTVAEENCANRELPMVTLSQALT